MAADNRITAAEANRIYLLHRHRTQPANWMAGQPRVPAEA